MLRGSNKKQVLRMERERKLQFEAARSAVEEHTARLRAAKNVAGMGYPELHNLVQTVSQELGGVLECQFRQDVSETDEERIETMCLMRACQTEIMAAIDRAEAARRDYQANWENLKCWNRGNDGALDVHEIAMLLRQAQNQATQDSALLRVLRERAHSALTCYREQADFYRAKGQDAELRKVLLKMIDAAGTTIFFRDQVEAIYREFSAVRSCGESEAERESLDVQMHMLRKQNRQQAEMFARTGGKAAWEELVLSGDTVHKFKVPELCVVVSDRVVAAAQSEANCSQDFFAQFEMRAALVWDRLGVVPRRGQLGPGQDDLCRKLGVVPDFDGQVVGQLLFDEVTDLRAYCQELAKNNLAGRLPMSQHHLDHSIGPHFLVKSRVVPPFPFCDGGLSFDDTCAHDTLYLLLLMRSKLAPESEAEWRVSTNKNFSIQGQQLLDAFAEFSAKPADPASEDLHKRPAMPGSPDAEFSQLFLLDRELRFVLGNPKTRRCSTQSAFIKGVVFDIDKFGLKNATRALAGSAGDSAEGAMRRLAAHLRGPGAMAKLCVDAPRHMCALCGISEKGEQKFARCAACCATNYCSKGCQKEHWKRGHKAECAELKGAALKGELERSQWALDLAPQPRDQLQAAAAAAAAPPPPPATAAAASQVNGNTVLAGAGANGDGEDGAGGRQGVGDGALSIGSVVVIRGLERAVHFNTKRGIVTRVLEGDRVAVELEGLSREVSFKRASCILDVQEPRG